MAVTAVITEDEVGGKSASTPLRVRRMTVTADDLYGTGGFAFTLGGAAAAGENILAVLPQANNGNANGKFAQYDYAADKLLFLTGAGVEVAGAVDVSTESITVVVVSD